MNNHQKHMRLQQLKTAIYVLLVRSIILGNVLEAQTHAIDVRRQGMGILQGIARERETQSLVTRKSGEDCIQ